MVNFKQLHVHYLAHLTGSFISYLDCPRLVRWLVNQHQHSWRASAILRDICFSVHTLRLLYFSLLCTFILFYPHPPFLLLAAGHFLCKRPTPMTDWLSECCDCFWIEIKNFILSAKLTQTETMVSERQYHGCPTCILQPMCRCIVGANMAYMPTTWQTLAVCC